MNWIKRAFRSISYHKKNIFLMGGGGGGGAGRGRGVLCIRASSRDRIW